MPDWRAYVRENLPPLAVGPARENEIVAELALQLDEAYRDALASGLTDSDAAGRARGQIADWPALAREIDRAELPALAPARLLDGAARDLRYSTRFLRRNPVFTAIAVSTLAFGIGGNTAIFTVADAVALRGLPYRDPASLMAIETRKQQQPEIEPWTSALDFSDLRDSTRAFSAVAGISPVLSFVMTGGKEAERLEVLAVSATFFPMLGVDAALGRTFALTEDDRTHATSVVLLSDSFWRRRFGANPGVLGQSITLDSASYTVIGVLPADFRYQGEPLAGATSNVDVWLPPFSTGLSTTTRAVRYLKVIGRRKPGVSVEQARDDVRRIGADLAAQYPGTNRGFVVDAQPLAAQVKGRLRGAMLLLLGAVGFVLLMACANVASLLLSRASARGREISIRAALGASRYRLLRQLLAEGFVLALAGGACGLPLAYALLRLLVRAAPASLPLHDVSLDARALLFTTIAVMLCALLAGLPPAWRATRTDIESALRAGGRGLTGGSHRLRSVLVVVEVAAALLLLVGAGLMIRSFQHLLEVDPGFNPRDLVTISTQAPQSVRTAADRTTFYRSVHDRLSAMPGVLGVAAVSRLPLLGSNLGSWLYVEGHITPGQPGYDVEYRVATSDYFATMGIPLHAGRFFDARDEANPGVPILINQSAARKYWPGEDPVGKRVKLNSLETSPWFTVVGVVGDVRHAAIDADPRPEVYRPFAASPLFAPILVVRTTADPAPMVPALAAAVRASNAGVPAYNVFLMQTLVDRSGAQRRFLMLLLTGFAAAALLLAVIGIYGAVSQAVQQRTREIGLRMALGASPAAALWLVFEQGALLTAAGILAGSLAAAALTRTIGKLLFEVRPLDPAAFLAAALTLAAAAALACYLPARRATRVDPLAALRGD